MAPNNSLKTVTGTNRTQSAKPAESKSKVLFVDDEANILDTFRAGLRKNYAVTTALGPDEGLAAVREKGPFAVVVSDLKMPGMDGIEFLSRVATLAPDAARIMLTGHGDLEAAALAVNRGQIFRFLNKPTPIDEMTRVLEAGVRQYELVRAEKELLRGTLRGSLQVLSDILAVVNPKAFGRGERIRRLALRTGKFLHHKRGLHLELSAMLAQLGCVTLDAAILDKLNQGMELNEDEDQAFARHPVLAARLLRRIPRMEGVADVVARQLNRFAEDPTQPTEARILKAVHDYDSLRQGGKGLTNAFAILHGREGWYDPAVLEALEKTARMEQYDPASLRVAALLPGMLLETDLTSTEGTLLMARGQEFTETALARLESFAERGVIPEPVAVLVPRKK